MRRGMRRKKLKARRLDGTVCVPQSRCELKYPVATHIFEFSATFRNFAKFTKFAQIASLTTFSNFATFTKCTTFTSFSSAHNVYKAYKHHKEHTVYNIHKIVKGYIKTELFTTFTQRTKFSRFTKLTKFTKFTTFPKVPQCSAGPDFCNMRGRISTLAKTQALMTEKLIRHENQRKQHGGSTVALTSTFIFGLNITFGII